MEKELTDKFQKVSGTLFKDTESEEPGIVWALKKYIEKTQMQSFVDDKTIFSITSITRDQQEDTYFVSYTIFGSGALMGSTCTVHKNLILDLIREYKLNLIT